MFIRKGDKLLNTRNWTELVRPDQLVKDKRSSSSYGKFVCEPLERGFGTTIGNALRRVLLSSMQGAAIVAVRIEGVQHEFTTIPGVLEDVTDIVLNLKQVRLAMTTDEPQRLQLSANTKGQITASAIQENQRVKIVNPDQIIATLTDDIDLKLELEVRMGKGYVPADLHEGLAEEIGLIAIDSSFSPVVKAAYSVEQARVGQMTNYDKLVMEIWTDASVRPDEALAYAAKILKDQLSVFITFDDSEDEQGTSSQAHQDIDPLLFKSIEDLELSVRATNCLKSAGIAIFGELVQKSEHEILETRNFGRKSLEEIRRVVNKMGFDFGTVVPNFEEKFQEWLKKEENNETQEER
ncbi:DNA-directed RNA polymerase subunit alpha [Desulfonatronum thiosulfatophilum]|uniref:DNA-directed RNA polymerase subunit alpha n=1 Tax=Desulfonatronum thiosulfatophilum TaxID=617002 RepID=A0A1G6BMX9_9BACT|nr:DNA-directed RNA polymerase subunit alpha [Desulfonatronum thiosulfatophilum]SDB22010.1 DNA-directed RNA polymerase subunit alpha [Desulfonatronum thiosulfatophilum]